MGIQKQTWIIAVIVVTYCWTALADWPKRAEDDARWAVAERFMEAGQYNSAALVFGRIFDDYPGSQRAALKKAIALEKAGPTEAQVVPMGADGAPAAIGVAASYETAINIEPFGYWGKVGLHKLAKYYYDNGNDYECQLCIDQLRERFAGTRWAARADLLEAQLNGEDTTVAETKLAQEVASWEAYRKANKSLSNDDAADQARIARLESVAQRFPSTGSALQALESKGYLLIRNKRANEAIVTFKNIIDKAGREAIEPAIVQRAQSRLASLYHAAGRKAEALQEFDQLANKATDPTIESNATLQAAGLYFELLQPRRWSDEEVTVEEWQEVRDRCQKVKNLPRAKPREVARADLMILESYLWEKDPKECLRLAETFINSHDEQNYRRELATAHLFAGESLLRLGRAEESITHLRWITTEYEQKGKIWPWSYLTARTYYKLYDALRRTKAPEEEALAVAQFILENFPGTECADLIQASVDRHAAN